MPGDTALRFAEKQVKSLDKSYYLASVHTSPISQKKHH